MKSDKPLAPNSPEYYRAAADYDGVVRKVSEELSGITTENLTRWYLDRCTDFYSGLSLRNAKKGRSWWSAKPEKNQSQSYKLANRLASRIYVIRKMRKLKQILNHAFNTHIKSLEREHEASYTRALDKALYLAHSFKGCIGSILDDAYLYRNARLGRTFKQKGFDPVHNGYEVPREFGETIANAQHFRHLITLFEQHTQPVEKLKPKQKVAVLSSRISVEQVQNLLTSVGMGSTYAKPGEWAVAFRALVLNRIMSGIAPEVHRWAVLHTSVTEKMGQTFKNAWGEEVNEAHLSHKPSQKAVFRAVQAEGRKLLSFNG